MHCVVPEPIAGRSPVSYGLVCLAIRMHIKARKVMREFAPIYIYIYIYKGLDLGDDWRIRLALRRGSQFQGSWLNLVERCRLDASRESVRCLCSKKPMLVVVGNLEVGGKASCAQV